MRVSSYYKRCLGHAALSSHTFGLVADANKCSSSAANVATPQYDLDNNLVTPLSYLDVGKVSDCATI
jgi:hypothetical protein